MAALDLFGRRWALRILWELRGGAVGARELLVRCPGLSPSVLYERLRDLTAAGLVERSGQAYALSQLGRSLGSAIEPLDKWSRKWAQRFKEMETR